MPRSASSPRWRRVVWGGMRASYVAWVEAGGAMDVPDGMRLARYGRRGSRGLETCTHAMTAQLL